MDKCIENKFKIKNIDDYYQLMKSEVGLFEQIGSSSCYHIQPNYGKGFVERINLRNGVDINICTMELIKDMDFVCQMEESCFEIFYCAQGQITYGNCQKAIEKTIKANECDCWLNDSTQSWMNYPGQLPWKTISVHYQEQFINSFQELGSTPAEVEALRSVLGRCSQGSDCYCPSPDMEMAFHQIINCSHQGVARLLYLESKAAEIFSLFVCNQSILSEQKNYKIYLSQEDRTKLDLAKKIIVNNMQEPLSIVELAREIELNTYKLKVGFKEMWGTTIFGYLRDMRMEKARFLLGGARKSVIEAAQEVGYSNPSHFTSAFRKKYGINPNEYAKANRGTFLAR
jgi:AraC-like DNA-binding protein